MKRTDIIATLKTPWQREVEAGEVADEWSPERPIRVTGFVVEDRRFDQPRKTRTVNRPVYISADSVERLFRSISRDPEDRLARLAAGEPIETTANRYEWVIAP